MKQIKSIFLEGESRTLNQNESLRKRALSEDATINSEDA